MMEEYPLHNHSRKLKRREILIWLLETIQIVAICLMFLDRLWVLIPFILQTTAIVVLIKMLVETERSLLIMVEYVKQKDAENTNGKIPNQT